MPTTKIYENRSKKTVFIQDVGEIEPGARVSVTADGHPPINLENFPGVVDVLAEEAEKAEKKEAKK